MKKINIGYYKYFGNKQLLDLKKKFEEENPDYYLNLIPYSHDDMYSALQNKEIFLALTDPRDDDVSNFQLFKLCSVSLVVLTQKFSFFKGQQTIDKNDLIKIPNILVATTQDEKSELHYQKDILGINSPFMAVENLNEASLMAQSGSGYFLMNELTAPLLRNIDSLQKLFLLNNGKQLKQDYFVISNKMLDASERKILNKIKNRFKKLSACEQ